MIHHWLRQKHNLEEDDHDLFPIGAGQSRCRKLSHQKQFAMSGESGGPQLPAVLVEAILHIELCVNPVFPSAVHLCK